jgi:hypothetical protein
MTEPLFRHLRQTISERRRHQDVALSVLGIAGWHGNDCRKPQH